jgi:hypothetical protein
MTEMLNSKFNAQYTVTSSFQTANVPVTVTGVGFFDFLHGQTGVAPNGIELHAVLDVQFGSGGPTPTPTNTPNPTNTPTPTPSPTPNPGGNVIANTTATFSFWTYIDTTETSTTTCYDYFYAKLRTSSGVDIATVQRQCNINTHGWTQFPLNVAASLNAYKGQA